jgi:hypothetical protein
LKAHAWKVCIRETVSRVRIPLPPPIQPSRSKKSSGFFCLAGRLLHYIPLQISSCHLLAGCEDVDPRGDRGGGAHPERAQALAELAWSDTEILLAAA